MHLHQRQVHMRNAQADGSAPRKPLRLWPGVAIVLLQWTARFGLPLIDPDLTFYGVMAGPVGALAILVWWLFFSRAAWIDRLGGVAMIALAMVITRPFLDVSVATGAMGALFPILAIPGICLALVAAAVASRHLPAGRRRLTMAAAILLASAAWTTVRTGGFTGSFENDLAWRWTPTPEQRLVAQSQQPSVASGGETSPAASRADAPTAAPTSSQVARDVPATVSASAAPPPAKDSTSARDEARDGSDPPTPGIEWPGFRGRDRNGIVHGVRIHTDWSASPPTRLWRRPIGPGWSSFAVHGDVLYTQEQRGGEEIVAAYRMSTGAPVWMHRDPARFWESNGGAGPRGTPTLLDGRVYAFGATGILNVLDEASGRVVWSRNVSTDSKTTVPDWGFSSSPLIVGDLVIVAAAGKLVAYELSGGALRWVGPDGGAGYSSPHLVTIDGVAQVVILDQHGATSVSPADGTRLWDFSIGSNAMAAPIVQPAVTPEGDLLISDGTASALYRVAVGHGPSGWKVEERWKSTALKPFFNDFVVHKGHAFGFDGSILACVDLANGQRKWKGGRYGNGQLILLADQDLLLVVSEEGEVALVSAALDKFTELARIPAVESKTWNHPVVAGDLLLVRNGEEMTAFRLPGATR